MIATVLTRLGILCLTALLPNTLCARDRLPGHPVGQGPSRPVAVVSVERLRAHAACSDDAVAADSARRDPSNDGDPVTSRNPSAPLLCRPGRLDFADSFSPGQVSSRWFFRKYWSVEDGILLRNDLPQTNDRIFIKNPVYEDALIRFDFQFRGAREIRFVSGTPGHYNAVIHIHRDHFFVQTARDDSGPYFPYRHGECAYDFQPRKWYTLTVEFLGDQVVAHLDRDHLAYGRHPILNKRRNYFAFQVDRASAAFDNVQMFQAAPHPRQIENQAHIRSVSGKYPLKKSVRQQWEIQRRNAHEHLYQTDAAYRGLVLGVARQHDKQKQLYPDVFRSHKEFQHDIAERRKRLLAEDAEYKQTLFATYRAARAMDAFLVAREPQVDALPPSRRERELERLRTRFRKHPDYVALTSARDAAQRTLEQKYPKLFTTNADITASRRQARKRVQAEPAFKALIDATAAAYRAQQAYLLEHDKRLSELAVQLEGLNRAADGTPR